MRISKKQFHAFMSIEREDIGIRAAHALERTRCTAMQSGVGSANSCTLQYCRQCAESLLFRDNIRDLCVEAKSRFINKQQYGQVGGFQAINLPTNDLRDMKSD